MNDQSTIYIGFGLQKWMGWLLFPSLVSCILVPQNTYYLHTQLNKTRSTQEISYDSLSLMKLEAKLPRVLDLWIKKHPDQSIEWEIPKQLTFPEVRNQWTEHQDERTSWFAGNPLHPKGQLLVDGMLPDMYPVVTIEHMSLSIARGKISQNAIIELDW